MEDEAARMAVSTALLLYQLGNINGSFHLYGWPLQQMHLWRNGYWLLFESYNAFHVGNAISCIPSCHNL